MRTLRYNDVWLRVAATLLAAHFIVVYGIKETFFEVLLIPGYYYSVACSFVIAFTLFWVIKTITVRLDKKFDWKAKATERVPLQFLLGFVIPGIIAFLLAFIYFKLFHIDILNTLYLRFDYPMILIFLLLVNLYYVAYYFYLQMKHAEQQALKFQPVFNQEIIDEVRVAEETPAFQNKQIFLVNRGAQNIPIPVSEIAYFYRKDTCNFLSTKEGKDYSVTQPLDDVQAMLGDKDFFRANRQMLVSRSACKHFENLPFNKLQLFVTPAYKDEIIISQKRIKAFKDWISNELN